MRNKSHSTRNQTRGNVLSDALGAAGPGMVAGITLFNPDKVKDRSTYANPVAKREGIETVMVNGSIIFENGEFTGRYPEIPLKRR